MTETILYRARSLPVLQNRTYATSGEALASPVGDVELSVDHDTGLVCNRAFDDSKVVYDENYQNEQALSPRFKKHLNDVTSVIDRHFNGLSIMEVGCGKAHYLQMLRERGYDAVGVDPSFGGTSPFVVKAAYSKQLGVSAEAVVLRHVLEHIQNPMAFLFEILQGNKGGGLIYIEVPCFDWICENRTWFDIFYEHVNYFRLSDFHKLFGRVLEAGRLFGGQYIFVVADLASLRTPTRDPGDSFEMPPDFTASRNSLAALPHQPRAIWGGASKGVIFAMYLKNVGVNVDFAIDINPAKQGRFMPCSGLPIASPNVGLDSLPTGSEVLVMNPNYLDEIRERSDGKFNYRLIA